MKALEGQTLFDIAIQELGSAEAAFSLAVLNGLSITDSPSIIKELSLPAVANKSIADYYASKGLKPATDVIGFVDFSEIFDFTFDFTFE